MSNIAPPVAALIEEFSKLPGVGVKTAQRLTFFILRSPTDQARRLAEAIMRVKESIIYCSRCFNITETDPCPTCSNPSRDQELICVVEEPLDMLALEKTGVYKGLYHVLHGALSPVEGIMPKDLRIDELLQRVRSNKVREVILATNGVSRRHAEIRKVGTSVFLVDLDSLNKTLVNGTALKGGVEHLLKENDRINICGVV